MSAGVKAGLLVGVLIVVCGQVLPQPLGWTLYWGLCAVELVASTVITWRRTGLPFATAGMACGAVASVLLVGLNLTGHPWPVSPSGPFQLPLVWQVPVVALLVAGPVAFFVEGRVHRTAWRQWRDYMEDRSLWDLLCYRHIPVLRDRHGSSA